MIVGIGNDVIDIRRIEETLSRFGMRFIERMVESSHAVHKWTAFETGGPA